VALHPPPQRDEDERERLDRNLMELLGELRVALPGVQVLFAFLLVVPFTERFQDVSAFQKGVYFATLLCTAVSGVFLIAPSVHHRLVQKEHIVPRADALALVGLVFLALAMTGVLLLLTDFLFGSVTATLVCVVAAGLFATVWFGIPLRRRLED
jgi:hypothetical protein